MVSTAELGELEAEKRPVTDPESRLLASLVTDNHQDHLLDSASPHTLERGEQ